MKKVNKENRFIQSKLLAAEISNRNEVAIFTSSVMLFLLCLLCLLCLANVVIASPYSEELDRSAWTTIDTEGFGHQEAFDGDINLRWATRSDQQPARFIRFTQTAGDGPGSDGRPVYNDIQCGNGPSNAPTNTWDDEDFCPGQINVEGTEVERRLGCLNIGPTWKF